MGSLVQTLAEKLVELERTEAADADKDGLTIEHALGCAAVGDARDALTVLTLLAGRVTSSFTEDELFDEIEVRFFNQLLAYLERQAGMTAGDIGLGGRVDRLKEHALHSLRATEPAHVH